MHGQSPASPEGGRYLSRVGGGVVALGQTGERHPWISFFSIPAVIDLTSAWSVWSVRPASAGRKSSANLPV